MSLVARLLARLRGRTLVGGDEHGNLYYKWVESVSKAAESIAAEAEGESSVVSVERRTVRTPTGSSPQKFDAASIPPEWSAWLRKTRADPPSPEEAARNAARRERVRSLAAAIDQRRRLVVAGGVRGEAKAATVTERPLPFPLPTTTAAEGEEEASSSSSSSSAPSPQQPQQQQQQQQHSSMSGAFSAETWTPPPPREAKQKEEETTKR